MASVRIFVNSALFCLVLLISAFGQPCRAADLKVVYQDGETQSIRLNQDPSAIRSIEFGGGPAMPSSSSGPGIPVTLYWHMADDADLYLNGRPLRTYEPSFRSRGDEAPLPAFTASVTVKEGDVFTVGGRRGGSYGFMLIAVDDDNRVVFKSDTREWKVYEPGERPDWYLPHIARKSPSHKVTVQPDPWFPQKTLNSQYGNIAQSIWDSPDQRFAHMYGVVRFMH